MNPLTLHDVLLKKRIKEPTVVKLTDHEQRMLIEYGKYTPYL